MLSERVSTFLPLAGKIFPKQNPIQRVSLRPFIHLQTVIPSQQSQNRSLTTHTLTKNIELITNAPRIIPGKSPLQVLTSDAGRETERPLTIILSWLMSEKRHLLKYAHFYLNQGFDVLTVRATPWQLLFPVTGTQVIAKDILAFLTGNPQYHSTFLHGFSVGGYMFGEVLVLMEKDLKRYQEIADRIVGQIWDSVVDFEGIPTGFPSAVFPNNAVLRTSMEKYVRYHLHAFRDVATTHYLKASAAYHDTIIKSPALFLCSLDDPVGNIQGIQKVINKWESKDMTVYLKCWNSSPHVSHLHHHPEDYKQEMKAFLEKLDLLPYPEKFQLTQLSQRQ